MHLLFTRPDPGGFSDEELQIAARAVQNAMLRSLEGDSEQAHVFSESFLARMRALFRVDDRRRTIRRALQHAAIIVIGVFLAGALLLAFNPEARADFTRWIRSTYEKRFFYQFFSNASNKENLSLDCIPNVDFTWLPGDYDIQEIYNDGQKRMTMLFSKDDTIMLEYWLLHEYEYVEVFSDGFSHEEVEVNGCSADYYRSENEDKASMLIWTDANVAVMFNLNTSLPKETAIKIAENIKIYS